MATLEIEGRKVQVDDAFLSMSPEQQAATVDEIAASIGIKAGEQQPTGIQESKGMYRGTILPFEKNLDTGDVSFAMPGLLKGILESGAAAVTAPGRAMKGELPVVGPDGNTSPEAIAEAANMATWVNPTTPAFNTGKGIARMAGVDAGRTDLINAGKRVGVDIPRAVASDSAAMQQTGKLLSNVPVAGQPLRKAAQKTIGQLDDAARTVQTSLGTGEKTVAGDAMRKGITDFSKVTLGNKITALEDDLAKSVDLKKLTPLSKTKAVASEIVSFRQRKALPGDGHAVSVIKEAINREGLDFEGLRGLRSSVREMLDNPSLLPAGTSQAELKRIYSALTDDLKAAALNAGGETGLAKFNLANKTEALIARDRETLQRILGNNLSDEALTDRIVSMASNTSRANIKNLMLLKKGVSKETWDELGSAAFAKMGRDAEGKLTPDRLITDWGKMNPSAKKLIFGTGETAAAIEDIVKVSSRFKQLNQYANPSGTGQTVLGGAIGSGFIADPVTTIGSTLGAYGASLYLSRPATAKAVAQYAKAYEAAVRLPGKSTQEALAAQARKLAIVAANDAGRPDIASSIASKLATPQKAAADNPDNQALGNPEGQPQADNPDKRFNDAYLQGRAL